MNENYQIVIWIKDGQNNQRWNNGLSHQKDLQNIF